MSTRVTSGASGAMAMAVLGVALCAPACSGGETGGLTTSGGGAVGGAAGCPAGLTEWLVRAIE